MDKIFLLFFTFAFCSGCIGHPPSPSPAALPPEEEFDPQSLHEDLLLIQPTFSPSSLTAKCADAEVEADSTEVGERTIFRVQLMALSNSQVAQQRRSELERELGVPVVVECERNLYMIRAGAFPTAEAARHFRNQLASRDSAYADAYVVSSKAGLAIDAAPSLQSDAALSDSISPPVLMPIFGWRILLDQFLSPREAEWLQRDAMARLERTDIDITFKAPWYKVEVGYFRTEAAAQEALEEIKMLYPHALKVRGQIFVPQEE